MVAPIPTASLGQMTTAALEMGALVQSERGFTCADITLMRQVTDDLKVDSRFRYDAVQKLLIGYSLFRPIDTEKARQLMGLLNEPVNKLYITSKHMFDDEASHIASVGRAIEASLNALRDLASWSARPELSIRHREFLRLYQQHAGKEVSREDACQVIAAFKNLFTDLLLAEIPDRIPCRNSAESLRLREHFQAILNRCLGGDRLPFWEQKIIASELRAFAVAFAEAYDDLRLADGTLKFPPPWEELTNHFLIGTRPTLEDHLKSLSDNMKGFRRVFPSAMASALFNRKATLSAEIKDPAGQPTGYFLVLQRGRHEYEFGLELSILEGPPRENGLNDLAKIGFHFGEGELQIVNVQGPPQQTIQQTAEDIAQFIHNKGDIEKLRTGRLAPLLQANPFLAEFLEETLRRFREGETRAEALARIPEWVQKRRGKLSETLKGASPLDLLIMAAISLSRSWAYGKIRGVGDEAQKAREDESHRGLVGGGYYDLFWLRFGFSKSATVTDFWEREVPGSSEALKAESARILPRSSRDRPRKWKNQEADPDAPPVQAFWEIVAPALSLLELNSTDDKPK